MVLAMKYLKGRMKEGSFEHEEQFLLNKVWDQLRGKDEGKEFITDVKTNDILEIQDIKRHCTQRIEDDEREVDDDDDVDDYDKSGGAEAVTEKLPPRPIIVPTLTSPHHISHPNPCPRPPPIAQLSFPFPLSCHNQDLPKNNNENSCVSANPKLIIEASKDTVAVRSASSSNGNPVKSESLTGIASVTSQSTRLALVDAAAAIAKRRAATVAVNVTVHVDKDKDKECIQRTSSSQFQQQHQQQPLRQPLRTLPFHQEQSTAPHNVEEFRIYSPDKLDPKSVLEKRIGAMR